MVAVFLKRMDLQLEKIHDIHDPAILEALFHIQQVADKPQVSLREVYEEAYIQLNRIFHAENMHISTCSNDKIVTYVFYRDKHDHTWPGQHVLGEEKHFTDDVIISKAPYICDVTKTGEYQTKEHALYRMGAPIVDGDGVVRGALVVQSYDKTYVYEEQHKDMLTVLGRRLGVIFEQVQNRQIANALMNSDMVLVLQRGRVSYVNEATATRLGYATANEILNREIWSGIADDELGNIREKYLRHSQGDLAESYYISKLKTVSGDIVSVEITVDQISWRGDGALLVKMHDLSELKKYQNQIEEIIAHDQVTGLLNEAAFAKELQEALIDLQNSRKTDVDEHGLLIIQVDPFQKLKLYNRQFVSQVLKDAAGCMKSFISTKGNLPDGSLLARLGDTEFGLLVKQADSNEELARIANAMIEHLEMNDFCLDEGGKICLEPTIGITIARKDGDSSEVLLKNARRALHMTRGKQNRYRFFSEDTDRKITEHILRLNEVREAYAQHEFEFYVQPKCKIDGRITGFETLLRWQGHEDISPLDYLPILEELGFLNELTLKAIVDTAELLRTIKKFPYAKDITGAVNIPPAFLEESGFAEKLIDFFKVQQIPRGWFELEVLEESVANTAQPNIIENLGRLKAAKFKYSIDDFGTGQSSLDRVFNFRADKVKIDKTFITKLKDPEKILSLFRFISTVAECIVAEGVESPEHVALLSRPEFAQLNIEMQGYGIARPMPMSSFVAMFKEKKGRMFKPARGRSPNVLLHKPI
jgi:PAS domain S-box-containing protein/diguanylate cyclase (GGDEF)-like protein